MIMTLIEAKWDNKRKLRHITFTTHNEKKKERKRKERRKKK